MTRSKRVHGEKPLFWTRSSKDELLNFPEVVIDEMGTAPSVAQFGGQHPSAKPWRGEGPGVFEFVEDHRADAFRLVYTVKFENAIYALHVFQKKSTKGIATPAREMDLIRQRLLEAERDHGERQN